MMKIKYFFSFFLKIILFPFKIVVFFLIYLYKFCISPLLPHVCRFYPTCSSYFLQAVKEYGVIKGSIMGFNRILRCNPFNEGGLDLIKPNIKGSFKWLL